MVKSLLTSIRQLVFQENRKTKVFGRNLITLFAAIVRGNAERRFRFCTSARGSQILLSKQCQVWQERLVLFPKLDGIVRVKRWRNELSGQLSVHSEFFIQNLAQRGWLCFGSFFFFAIQRTQKIIQQWLLLALLPGWWSTIARCCVRGGCRWCLDRGARRLMTNDGLDLVFCRGDFITCHHRYAIRVKVGIELNR